MKYDSLHDSEDYDSLKSNFEKLKKDYPDDTSIDRIYFNKLEKFDKKEESEKIKDEIINRLIHRIEKEPQNFNLRYKLSILYQHTFKEYEKSIEIYKFLIENNYKIDDVSDRALLYFKLHYCYENLKEYEKSINTLESSIDELNNHLESIKNSTLFSSSKDFNIQKINELMGENYKNIGHIYSKLKDERLVENYLKAIKLNPSLTYWYLAVGGWYYQKNDFENYQKYMDLWVETKEYFINNYNKKNKPIMLNNQLKSYILRLFEIGDEEKSLNLCKNLIHNDVSDYELPNIFSLLTEYYLIKKSKTEKQYSKWVKSKQSRFKKLKKKLNNYIKTHPDFELMSRIKYVPYSWRKIDMEQTRKRAKSKQVEEKSIINALHELENDIFLVSQLFETSPYIIIKIMIHSNKDHLKLFQ